MGGPQVTSTLPKVKILWVKSDFLHPTTKGGQIRTLEMLKRIHARHEVHYVGMQAPGDKEGFGRAGEYSTKAWAVDHAPPDKKSLGFAAQLFRGLFSQMPVAVQRWVSPAKRKLLRQLMAENEYDAVVCDFLAPAPHFDLLSNCVLFQHNVESMIWERQAQSARGALRRWYFGEQAKRMHTYEGTVCRSVRRVIAVSEADAREMERRFGLKKVFSVPTGVDVDYFARPESVAGDQAAEFRADIVFVGSMDWMPNVDGIEWFVAEVLPLIRRELPGTTVAIVGRKPPAGIIELANKDAAIKVTGTVPDVRPYLWGSSISVVPLRIGGGTRIKIYEAMAAYSPVISTAIGAEGLDVKHGENILLADDPSAFASACVTLLRDAAQRSRIAASAQKHVTAHYSWEGVAAIFEKLLQEQ